MFKMQSKYICLNTEYRLKASPYVKKEVQLNI